ncbi:MAG: rhodanese-like domain-containing protein [Methyloprofundus sp.]|uniref:rhodanese-like domain-containing protein n=1 Tax=Methyloprofundus sp. TaxID=2020875 RepID=UPI001A1426DE|nr:rhodanese-like domain-containing protein [Methyloprofundus sp.]HIL77744.1 rhodanese-like domain-containing protein [Methylococcales bacterium]
MHIKNFIKYSLIFFLLFSGKILSAAELTNLTPGQVNKSLNNETLVIDIRTPREWQTTGIIPGSHPVKFFDQNGKYDTQQWLAAVQKLQSSPDQEIILVCHSGGRSGKVGKLLSKKLNMPNVSHLQNGIKSWIKEQRPTEKACTATQTC